MQNAPVFIENCVTSNVPGLLWQVNRSVKCLAPDSLLGISKITLRDYLPHNRPGSELEQTVFGYYFTKDARNPASIELYVQPIYRDLPQLFWWSTVPTIRIVQTLAHEVGHHLHLGRRKLEAQNSDTEAVARDYSVQTIARLKKKWRYKLGFWWINEIAFWHYSMGILDGQAGKHEAAARHFYSAWNLNPQLENVAAYYWKAKEQSQRAK